VVTGSPQVVTELATHLVIGSSLLRTVRNLNSPMLGASYQLKFDNFVYANGSRLSTVQLKLPVNRKV
jgi:hypothetical protein